MMINFTKNQTLILNIFFNYPDKSYYLRQLGRMLGKEPGVFQKDINKLVKSGILLSEYRANSRFFRLNKNHPLYEELKSIIFKTIGVEGMLKKELKKIKGIKRAFIFGSFARQKENSASDIDLMIIGDIDDEDLLISKIVKLEKLLKREINYHFISEKEWQAKSKQDSFIKTVISGPKIEIL